MILTQMPDLYIRHHPQKGRSVCCAEDITKGALIELCPVIVLSEKDGQLIHQTHLHDYYFLWEDKQNSTAIALGYGSLYNHAQNANAETESNIDAREIRIIAIRDIPAGEEITINYQGVASADGTNLWFEVQ